MHAATLTGLLAFLPAWFFAFGAREDTVFFSSQQLGLKELDDIELMARIREGNHPAFAELFERWKRPLISFFYRGLSDYHTAEDLTLTVARKVFQASDRYRPTAKFSTWLFQIAHNCLRDEYRRQRSNPRGSELLPDWDYPQDGGDGSGERMREWEDWLEFSLQKLPPKEREILLLTAQQGFSPAEAAVVLKMTDNHARVLLHKARKRLEEIWKSSL
jgi:RNA polymerase sigma-70 factor (ECF subfamily)